MRFTLRARLRKITLCLVIAAVGSTSAVAISAAPSGAGTQVPVPITFSPPEPTTPRVELGLRGGKGKPNPPTTTIKPIYTAYPGIIYTPGGQPLYPEEWVCVAWDFIKKVCTGWKRKNDASANQIWAAAGGAPIMNYIWVPLTEIAYTRLGYAGTRQVDNGDGQTICIGFNYYLNKCAMWRNWYPPLVQQFPPVNFIWADPYQADYLDSNGYDWPFNLLWF